MLKKPFLLGMAAVVILLIVSFFIPKETKPSPDTRIILEHNYKTYITPPCFDQSNATNFLQDATLGEAQNLNYEPNDACTEQSIKSEEDSLFTSVLKDVGILEKKWDKW